MSLDLPAFEMSPVRRAEQKPSGNMKYYINQTVQYAVDIYRLVSYR